MSDANTTDGVWSNGGKTWDPAPAAKISKTVTPIYAVCLAYESGFGHGLAGRALPQPYALGTGEHEAYQIGYDAGLKKRPVPDSTGEHSNDR